MGIPGIYKQIGPGERTALSQIAVQHLEQTGHPLRIAIDISIWQFQIQSGQGGKNPALRTLYYRLLRLLALSIHPLFVFDGPDKPPFKRGRKLTPGAASLPNSHTKKLLECFGFPYHIAPGEAEAECALLQKENLVDAVLSEDVDTMMFGCSMTMRTWTAEGARGGKSPTHVNVYRAKSTKEEKGLDSEGMILIALMSGGDYVPAGITGCGIKTACEAAKAGFGRDLCQLSKDDTDGMMRWRERLERELQTNESKLFRQKHKAMKIPNTFPDTAVLGHYTHPAITSAENLARLRDEIRWDREVNVQDLRSFVADAFDWQLLSGAKKFVRGLAPALLTRQLIKNQTSCSDNEDLQAMENKLVKCICGRRTHWNTGGEPELRIAYIPIDIVGLDLRSEEQDSIQSNGQDVSGDEQPMSEVDETVGRSESPAKRRGPSTYDPAQVEKIWVLETYVKLGVPLHVETWEEDMRDPKKFASRKAREKAKVAELKAGVESASLDQYVRLTKPTSTDPATKLPTKTRASTQLPPIYLAPAAVDMSTSQQQQVLAENRKPPGQKAQKQKPPAAAKAKQTPKAPSATQAPTPPKHRTTNPWTLAKRTPEHPKFKFPPLATPQQPHNPSPSRIPNPPSPSPSPSPPPPKTKPKNLHPRPTTPLSDTSPPPPINPNVTLRPRPRKPSLRDPTKPSPRKKRSPLHLANELFLSGRLLTPTKTPQHVTATLPNPDNLTSQKANRRLDFTEPQAPGSPISISSSLPSPSTLLAPINTLNTETSIGASESPSKIQPSAKTPGARKLVALRESLEGAWKHLEPWELEAGSRGRRVFSSVEVVDLTGG